MNVSYRVVSFLKQPHNRPQNNLKSTLETGGQQMHSIFNQLTKKWFPLTNKKIGEKPHGM